MQKYYRKIFVGISLFLFVNFTQQVKASELYGFISCSPPYAFDTTSSKFCLSLFVNSNCNVVSYLWDYGNGTTSTLSDGGGCFNYPALYNITVTCGCDNGLIDTITQDIYFYSQFFYDCSFIGTGNLEIENNSIQIYPNPTSDEFTIMNPEKSALLRVFNSTGIQVLTDELHYGMNKIETASLAQGIYFVEYLTDTKRKNTYLIKN